MSSKSRTKKPSGRNNPSTMKLSARPKTTLRVLMSTSKAYFQNQNLEYPPEELFVMEGEFDITRKIRPVGDTLFNPGWSKAVTKEMVKELIDAIADGMLGDETMVTPIHVVIQGKTILLDDKPHRTHSSRCQIQPLTSLN